MELNANHVEAILFGAARPVKLSEMKSLLSNQGIKVELSEIKEVLNDLELRYQDTSLSILEVASGYRLQIKSEFSELIYPMWSDTQARTSKALMETISIIAYKQPVTRGDIEDIRGVSVSSQIIRTLLDKNWIQAAGYRDVPGRPTLYKTTTNFLDDKPYFYSLIAMISFQKLHRTFATLIMSIYCFERLHNLFTETLEAVKDYTRCE